MISSMMLYFFISFIISVFLTFLIKKFAYGAGVVDTPDTSRHLHAKPTPLLGGLAIFLSFWVTVCTVMVYFPVYGIEKIIDPLMVALVGSLIIMLVGIADDLRPFSAAIRLPLVAVAILIVTLFFPWLTKITNPLGGYLFLANAVGSVLVFCWFLGMTYTTKILDGLDGLAAGVVSIGAFIIVLLTAVTKFYQPNVSLVALIFLGSCLGFLLFNFHPAQIFLGESGSMFIGFMLAVLAVIGGGKLATALLVMAIPVLDVLRVMYIRIRKKQSIFSGDREHLHFRMVDAGFTQKQSVLFLYAISFFFGIATLFLQSLQKVYALAALIVIMVVLSHIVGKNKKTYV